MCIVFGINIGDIGAFGISTHFVTSENTQIKKKQNE